MHAGQQIIINDLDDFDDDDGDDELMITKVESVREREAALAAQAQKEISRLQAQQLQAKFDHANHRKAQVPPDPVLLARYQPGPLSATLMCTLAMSQVASQNA